MVVESLARSRPKRSTAAKGVQDAVRLMTEKGNDQPKSGSLAKKPVMRKSAPVIADVDSASTESDLSDLSEEEEEAEEHFHSAAEEEEEEDVDDSDDDDEDAYAPSSARVRPSSKKRKGASLQTKKVTKQRLGRTKAVKATKESAKPARKERTSAAVGPSRVRRGAGSKEDLHIEQDNVLFNAIKGHSENNLRGIAEEWISEYQDDRPAALAQFINFVFRSSGCNASIDGVQVQDMDNIVEMLNEAQDEFKKQNLPSYPLVSRSSTFRRFRRSLSELMEFLFTAASDADVLVDEVLVDTLIAWLSATSSSPYRALRHTATTFALLMMGQIARLNQEARKQFEQACKARDAEKASNAKGVKALKALNEQVRQANTMRQLLDTYHRELDETVFVHRYRDTDPTIRADCMEELGRWMRICPAQFLSSKYLGYFAWELSDESAIVRLVVVQALTPIYALKQQSSALQLFSERLLPRMIEIATADVDTTVRIAMIGALMHLDQVYPIEDDEERESLAGHIFDSDAKVRIAVARFVANMIEEKLDVSSPGSEKQRFKAMGALISGLGSKLDEVDHPESSLQTTSIDGISTQSRVSLAFGALWTVSEKLRDWKPLLALLQVDHSEGQKKGNSKRNAGVTETAQVLSDVQPSEEAVLVECLVVLLQKAQESITQAATGHAKARSATPERETLDEITKDLIAALPKLFSKYKTESGRIGDVLLLPKHMNLALYLEYEQMSAYDALWDHIIDQFQRHTEVVIAERAVEAMATLCAAASLSSVNDTKLHHLRESVVDSLKDSVASLAHLSDARALDFDQVHRLTACTTRCKALFRRFDLTLNFDESEDEQEGETWDIFVAVAQRSSFENEEELHMVENAVVILALYVMWKTRSIILMEEGHGKAAQAEALVTKRQTLLSLCERILETGATADKMSNVQRQAFCHLLDICIMYANLHAADEQRACVDQDAIPKLPEALRLPCTAGTQAILANFVAHETSRFHAWVQAEKDALQPTEGQEEVALLALQRSFNFLRVDHAFVSTISHFVGAIHLGVIDISYCAPMLAYFGRLTVLYDACIRVLVESIREIGIDEQRANVACRSLFQSLVHALDFVAKEPETEQTFVNLAKMLSSCLVVRGTQLTIKRRMDPKAVVRLHELCIEWIARRLQDADGHADPSEYDLSALTMFKAIANLLVSAQPRDAMAIKSSLQRIFSLHNVDIPATSAKSWDALHSYERRLVTIASKSEAIARQIASSTTKPNTPSKRKAVEAEEPNSPSLAAASRPRPRARANIVSTQESQSAAGKRSILTQQDEQFVDSLLGDDTIADPDDDQLGMDSAALSMPAFDLSQETSSSRQASQALFRGMPDVSQTQSLAVRPSRRARPSNSMAEEDSDEDDDVRLSLRHRKRSRQD